MRECGSFVSGQSGQLAVGSWQWVRQESAARNSHAWPGLGWSGLGFSVPAEHHDSSASRVEFQMLLIAAARLFLAFHLVSVFRQALL